MKVKFIIQDQTISLMHRIEDLTESYGEQPYIVFKSTGVYSRQLERFMNENGFTYCPLNPLETKLQCDSLRTHYSTNRLNRKGIEELFLQLMSLSRFIVNWMMYLQHATGCIK